MRQTAWKALATLSAIGAGIGMRKLLTAGWQATTGDEPPKNPADPATDLGGALLWSTAVGAAVGVARMAGRRGAAEAWRRSEGELPSELQPA